MASFLGAPVTSKFVLGAAELRIGAMTLAGRMLGSHSVGVIDSWGYAVSNEYVDLESGFPRQLLDKALIKATGKLTFVTREYTLRNIKALTGGAVVDYPTAGGDLVATIDTTSAVTAGSTAITMKSTVAFTEGMTVALYSTTDPTKVTISTVASCATTALVLTTGLGLLVGFDKDEVCKVSLCQTFGGGSRGEVAYFAAQLVYIDRATSRPTVVDFWKCASGSGVDIASSGTDFSSQTWDVGLLVPTAADYASSGPLYAQRVAVAANPLFRVAGPLDIL
jgi:hypothetical protein